MATEAADLIIKVRVSGTAQATAELLAVDKAVDSAADSAISAKPPMEGFGGSLGGIGTQVGLIAAAVALLGPSVGALGATVGGLAAATPGLVGLGGAFAYIGVQAIKAKTGAEDLSEAFTELTKAGTPIGNALKDLNAAARPFYDRFFNFINTIGPQLIGTFEKLVTIMGKHLGPLFKVIGSEAGKWGELFVQSAKLVAPLMDDLFLSLSKTLRLLLEAFLPAIKPALKAFMAIFEGLGKGLIRWFKPMIPTIKVLGRAMGDFLKVFGTTLGKAFDKSGPQIKALFSILSSVLKLLEPIFSAVTDALVIVMPPLAKFIDQLVKFLVPILRALGKEFSKMLAELLPPFAKALTQLLKAARPLIPIFIKLAKMAMRGMMDAMLKSLPFITDLIRWIVRLAKGIKGFVKDAKRWWEDFKNGIQAMKDWVIEKWNSLLDWFRSLPGRIKRIFTGAVNWLKDVGRNIWEGLLDGLRSKWEEVQGWLSDRWEDIKNLPGKLLELFSPSRVFRRIGQNIVKGLHIGLRDEGANLSRAVDETFARIHGSGTLGVAGGARGMAVAGARGRTLHGTLRIVGTERLYALIDARVDEGLGARDRYDKRRSRVKLTQRVEAGAE